MRVKYIIDAVLVDETGGDIGWKPIGVWAICPDDLSASFDWKYLPGNEAREEFADQVATRLVERDVRVLPEDFLEYHQSSYSSYIGQFIGPFEAEFANMPACCQAILGKILKGELGSLNG